MRFFAPALVRRALPVLAILIALWTLAGSVAVAEADRELPEPDTGWFEGAAGYASGFVQAQAQDQPILVYFYADWCGYCRQLETDLLETSSVVDYTQYLVKIRVNPEKGDEERRLAGRYGVAGYPSVFIHSEASLRPRRVARMVVERSKRRLMTPAEYVQTLAAITGLDLGAS